MIASLIFLTPWAGLLATLALVPLAAYGVAARRVRRARALLRLAAPGALRSRLALAALVLVPLLIALAAMQPALRTRGSVPVRADAAVFTVVDTSSSMAAKAGAGAPSRLEQARRVALAVGDGLPGVPVGVATFTDRVLPNLFPTVDNAAYASTLRALTTDSPPPREVSRVATSFGALAALQRADFFTKQQTHRALLLVSDGESSSFDGAALARALSARPAVHLFVVRVGGGGDRLYASDGRPGGRYRADPAGAARAISQLTTATGGTAFASSAGVASAIRQALGPGPTTRVQQSPSTRTLAPVVALASLLPLLLVLAVSATLSATRRVT